MSSLVNVQLLQDKQELLDLLTTLQLAKSLSAFTSQLEPENITNFFKCMSSSCDFSTDDDNLFLVHLSTHQEPSFQCAYCAVLFVSEVGLVNHVATRHAACRFQCSYCFYRCRNKAHLLVHAAMVHKSKPVCWSVCRERSLVLKESCRSIEICSKLYVCASSSRCQFRCVNPLELQDHLSEIHADCRQYPCHLCFRQVFNPSSLVKHYADVHGFCPVECLYCDVSDEDEWAVLRHVMQDHADEPFRILLRNGEAANLPDRLADLCKMRTAKCANDPEFESAGKSPTEVSEPFESCSDRKFAFPSSAAGPSLINMNISCNLNCSMSFTSVTHFVNHIRDEHEGELAFSCPRCSMLKNAPLGNLFAHLVKAHTSLQHCSYKDCFFTGQTQRAVDDHIMEVHQTFSPSLDDDDMTGESQEEATKAAIVPSAQPPPETRAAISGMQSELGAAESLKLCPQQDSEVSRPEFGKTAAVQVTMVPSKKCSYPKRLRSLESEYCTAKVDSTEKGQTFLRLKNGGQVCCHKLEDVIQAEPVVRISKLRLV